MIKPPFPTLVNRGHPLADRLVAAWLFNDNPQALGSAFDTIGGHHGDLVGDAQTIAGKFGAALDLDSGSDDYTNHPNTEIGWAVSKFTVSAWVLLKSTAANSAICGYFPTAGDQAWFLRWRQSNTTFRFSVRAEGSGSDTSTFSSTFNTADVWKHVVGVADGANLILYVDGVQSGTPTAFTGVTEDRSTTFRIGQAGTTSSNNNKIDNLMVWDRALSALDVAWLYRDTFAMFKSIPIELWVGSVGTAAAATSNPWYVYANN